MKYPVKHSVFVVLLVAVAVVLAVVTAGCKKRNAASDDDDATEASHNTSREPVAVVTPSPSSMAERDSSASNVVTVLIAKEGKVFIRLADTDAQHTSEVVWPAELRRKVLEKALARYNALHPNKRISLTPKQMRTFTESDIIGVPIGVLPAFLDKSVEQRDRMLADLADDNVGIPVGGSHDQNNPGEFMIWMEAIRDACTPEMTDVMRRGTGIVIIADKDAPYEFFHEVTNDLQGLDMNRFTLNTVPDTDE